MHIFFFIKSARKIQQVINHINLLSGYQEHYPPLGTTYPWHDKDYQVIHNGGTKGAKVGGMGEVSATKGTPVGEEAKSSGKFMEEDAPHVGSGLPVLMSSHMCSGCIAHEGQGGS